jgi:hypothetical protein
LIGYQPNIVRTQDYVGAYGDGDHSDHYTTAYLTQAASRVYNNVSHKLIGYLGYPVISRPANVSGHLLMRKANAFLAYAPHDVEVPQTRTRLMRSNYWIWMCRQYPVSAASGTVIRPTASLKNGP